MAKYESRNWKDNTYFFQPMVYAYEGIPDDPRKWSRKADIVVNNKTGQVLKNRFGASNMTKEHSHDI